MIRDWKQCKLPPELNAAGSSVWKEKLAVPTVLTWSPQLILVFSTWYFFSFVTLFSNKFILMNPSNDPTILGLYTQNIFSLM